jgi:hypothetical protein
VIGEPPRRRRTMPNPLNLDEYMAHVAGGAAVSAGASGE